MRQKHLVKMKVYPHSDNGWSASPGNIGVPLKHGAKTAIEWSHCREVFSRKWTRRKRTKPWGYSIIFFRNSIERTFDWITEIESALNLKKRSSFGPTTINGVLWVRFSSWWGATPVRRQFFTLCLKASLVPACPQKAISRYSLMAQTTPAVKRFLSGYTKLKGNPKTMKGRHGGWYSTFRQHNDENTTEWTDRINSLLVK